MRETTQRADASWLFVGARSIEKTDAEPTRNVGERWGQRWNQRVESGYETARHSRRSKI